MKTFLMLVFCLLVIHHEGIGAEVDSIGSKSQGMEWRKEILQGISVLPKLIDPGRIVVYGKHAEPILTGSNEEDVLVAAAEFGKGRIVAISHNFYADYFMGTGHPHDVVIKMFHTNLKQWLTRGTYEKENSILNSRDSVTKERLVSSKIVVFGGIFDNIPSDDVTEYVRNGGALLHCMDTARWLIQNKGKPLSDVPYVSLLGKAGIYYNPEHISAPYDGLSVKDNKAANAHLLRVLEYVGTNIDKVGEKINMLQKLKYIPKEEIMQVSNGVRAIVDRYTEEIDKRIVPSPTHIVTNKRDKDILNKWLFFCNILEPSNIKAPGVNLFPGDFSTEPELKTRTIEIHSDLQDFHSTGCYLPAGQTLKVEVLSGNEEHDWELMIGSHTDKLWDNDWRRCQVDGWRRWPEVTKEVTLVEKSLQISTPFGGLIYLISRERSNRNISVKLENVVDSPWFRLSKGEQGRDTWEHSRLSSGLWADISGELITITLPSSSVRDLDFDVLTSVMKIWDSVVRLSRDLRGIDASKFRREWFVTDEQPSRGYMHAGYPIVTHLDVAEPNGNYFLLNGSNLLREGNWDPFHEIGHNMQRDEWTFDGAWELTVNIFTLCAMDVICHIKPWVHPKLQDHVIEAQKFLKDRANLGKWEASEGYAILVYAQLARDFGWESYKNVFRRYETMYLSEIPKNNQMKIDTWFSIFSEVVGFNLSPLALFWAIPISDEALTRFQTAFPVAFLPDDEVTQFVPDRVDAILKKFPSIVRKNLAKTLSDKSDSLILD